MEEIGNIKSFRNNLMIISLLTILLFLFSDNITKINIFGLIELQDIKTIKFLLLTFLVNLYILIRYYQYLIKFNIDTNKKILVADIINNSYFKKNILSAGKWSFKNNTFSVLSCDEEFKKNDINSIEYFGGSISLNCKGNKYFFFCHNLMTNNNIKGGFYSTFEDKKKECLSVYLHNYDKKYLSDNISILYKSNSILLFILKIKFYIKEQYFSDYYLPVLLGIISLELLVIKITYLILSK